MEYSNSNGFGMNIYLASSPILNAMFIAKIGCTENPYSRRSTYRTSCPPGLTPSHDIEYDGMWETTATSRDELMEHEDEVHNHFIKFRMMRNIPGDSEWFKFQGIPYAMVNAFMNTRPWMKRQVPLSEIAPLKRTTQYMRKQYHKNLAFIKTRVKRNGVLNDIQQPVIHGGDCKVY